jgi:single-stranded-DNA-specific exonuclease
MISTLAPPAPRWVFPDPVADGPVRALQASLGLPLPLCRLLVQREIASESEAREFLRPHPGQLHAPDGLVGMGDAVQRIADAISRGETMLVHGDYDVDGICSAALLTRAFRAMGGRVEAFVPDRLRDGYDLTGGGLRAAHEAGARLVVTCDCGIVAHAAIEEAARAGIDVVVTDHHTPGDRLPAARAVVNPNRADCAYPDKGLAGVGVAFKLAQGVAAAVGYAEERLQAYLDLVAIATVADMAPLAGENRTLVRWGLRVLQSTPNVGLRALMRASGLEGEVTAGQVGHILGPRINAVGRIRDPMTGLRLLLTDDPAEAASLAGELEAANRERREVDAATLAEALAMLERSYDPDRDRAVVLAGEGWHPGVIGIVASRVVERIHRPAVLIALNGGEEARGSARSIRGFHLYDAMASCAGHLTRFGGHRHAAGCSLRPEDIDAFRTAFCEAAAAGIEEEALRPQLRIDLDLPLTEADGTLCSMLRHAAPFGLGNPTPVLAARGVTVEGARTVGDGRHLKLRLRDGACTLDGIGFGMGDRLAESTAGPVDVAFRLEENVWKGRARLQARVVDLRPAA